jgi:GAF domain-containing protein
VNISINTPYPGTESWIGEAGRVVSRDYRLYDIQHAVLPTKLPLAEFYEELVTTQQALYRKHVGWRRLMKMAGVVAGQLARGQTNFLGSLFGLERVFRPVARAATSQPSAESTGTIWGNAPAILSAGGGSPITPIEEMKTCLCWGCVDDCMIRLDCRSRRGPQMSATRENTLADPEQLIADLQRQLAECRAARDEALEQQTAAAEVLQVINSSPGDLTPVFDAMLEKALRLCNAAFGVLVVDDGNTVTPAAMRGLPDRFVEYLSTTTDQPSPEGAHSRLRRGEDVVQIQDLTEGKAYRSGTDPYRRAIIELGGVRTVLTVALRKEDRLLGSFNIYRHEVHPFSEKQIALLENFAAQAVIAMENARLLGELRQRTEELADLNRGLEARVSEQVDELGRVGRLKRFLAPQLAELIVSQGDEKILESHRREIVVVFCDLRGYTAFTETAEPEEVLEFLREYHGALGPLVSQFVPSKPQMKRSMLPVRCSVMSREGGRGSSPRRVARKSA